MPRRERHDTPQTIHHVIQRGNNRNYIYEDIRDKRQFLSILSTALANYDATLLQYVLMDNHYHLLIRVGVHPLSDLIWYLNRKYSVYYNQRYNRIGTIYGDRYKSFLITEKQKFYSTVRYIVQNPVKAGIVNTAIQYQFSGHRAVLKNECRFIDRSALLSYFSPEQRIALKRYKSCTEDSSWSPQIGFATILDPKAEAEERLAYLLDNLLTEQNMTDQKNRLRSGYSSPSLRDIRTSFITLAISDGHALKEIAQYLNISYETVRRISKQSN